MMTGALTLPPTFFSPVSTDQSHFEVTQLRQTCKHDPLTDERKSERARAADSLGTAEHNFINESKFYISITWQRL